MRKMLIVSAFVGLLVAFAAAVWSTAQAADPPASSDRVFELRTYVTFPGKLEDLHKRFRNAHLPAVQEARDRAGRILDAGRGPGVEKHADLPRRLPEQGGAGQGLGRVRGRPGVAEGVQGIAQERRDRRPDQLKSQNLVPTDYSPIR